MSQQGFSPFQKEIADSQSKIPHHQKKLLTVRKTAFWPVRRFCAIFSGHQQFSDRHPYDNCASLCFTLCHHN
jgi:hypothetical protein